MEIVIFKYWENTVLALTLEKILIFALLILKDQHYTFPLVFSPTWTEFYLRTIYQIKMMFYGLG